jgi:hypothetical protein
MRLVGGKSNPSLEGRDELPGAAHYFMGSDSELWVTGVPGFAGVAYRDVYPGIDLVFRGQGRELEYDLVVAPGADPDVIRLRFDGVLALALDGEGALVLATSAGDHRFLAPKVYQVIDGALAAERVEVGKPAGFAKRANDVPRRAVQSDDQNFGLWAFDPRELVARVLYSADW